MRPKLCNLCKKKLEKIVVVANKIYGDKSKKRKFYHCLKCDVRFMNPPLSHKEELKFYKKEFEKFMSKRSGKKANWLKPVDHLKINKKVFDRRFNYLNKLINKKNKILEIGCSSGFMLKNLKKKNFKKCYGIEPRYFQNFYENRK